MGALSCFLSPVSCAGTTLAKVTLSDLFGSLTLWVLGSVAWLLSAAARVLTSASEPSTVVRAASAEFNVLLTVSPVIMGVGLMVATMQAVRHGDSGSLVRVYFGVAPACVAGVLLARPLTLLVLEAVDQLAATAGSTVAQHEPALVTAFSRLSVSTPGFGLFLLATAVVVGGWLLWCELIVRTVALTLLLVLVPVIVPLATFPAMRRVGWRLGETFLAVAASKLLIVIALSLGLDELEGSSATEVVTGAVTLVLATASPFLLLRLVPLVEQSALHHLEGVRQRFTRSVQHLPSSPLAVAARSLTPESPLPGPEARPPDLGLGLWPADGEFEFPSSTGEAPTPPVGTGRLRGGHVVYRHDDDGPVVGWHFDE